VLSCLESGLGAGNVESGRLMAGQGRKFTTPFENLLPEMPKGGGQGFQIMRVPEFVSLRG
jgi:hypothetical protein